MSSSLFRLVTLGRLALVDADGREEPSLQTRRRKLAVLAVLAVARRPVPRDRLLELFWGDQDEERARHSLSDALSHLRRVLGRDAITLGRTEVGLAAGAPLRTDAAELEAAARSGDHARVVATYAGPFLDGVYVPDSASFDHWVERERARLEALAVASCAALCAAHAEAGRMPECASVAARWLDVAPLSAEAAWRRLEALDAARTVESGRRALDDYERLRSRLRREFDLTPDPSVEALAGRIAARLADAPDATRLASPAPQATEAPAAAPVATPVTVAPASAPASRRWRRMRWALALAVPLLAVALALSIRRAMRAEAPPAPTEVAVFPFTVHGPPELGYLRVGMVDLLSTNLDGAGALQATDPRAVLAATASEANGGITDLATARTHARRLGAGRLVLGDVVASGGRLRVSAALYGSEGDETPLAQANAEGDASDIFTLVDELTAALVAGQLAGPGRRLERIAARTTHSVPALKAYLEGEEHWRRARAPEAAEAMRRAVELDSTFALAWYRLGVAQSWEARIEPAVDAMRHAMRLRGALTDHDRLLVEAYGAIVAGDGVTAEQLYETTVARYPTDVEAWAGLGEMLFHMNPMRGRSFTESRRAYERILRLEPANGGAAWHLLHVAAREGRAGEVDTLARRLLATATGGAALSLRLQRALAVGDMAAVHALLPALQASDDFGLILAVWRAGLVTNDVAALVTVATPLTAPTRLPEVRAVGWVTLAHLEAARGRWPAVDAHLAALAGVDANLATEYRALFAASLRSDLPRDSLRAEYERVRTWTPVEHAVVPGAADLWVNAHAGTHGQLRAYLLGLLAARLGDADAARRWAAVLDTTSGVRDALGREILAERRVLPVLQARGVRATLLAERGDTAGAIAALAPDEAPGTTPLGIGYGSARVSSFLAIAHERRLRAVLLRALGREEEARGWERGLREIFPLDVPWMAAADRAGAAVAVARRKAPASR